MYESINKVALILALECWDLFPDLIDRQQCGCSYMNDLTNEIKKKTNEKSLQEIKFLRKSYCFISVKWKITRVQYTWIF